MAKKNLWYTRRKHKEVRGPFPAGMISRYILLGRILETDELSADQSDWKPVSYFPELYPEEMKLDLSDPENQERLRMARVREDERDAGDRRQDQVQSGDKDRHQRSGKERRDDEPESLLRHREIRTRLLKSLGKNEERYYFRIALVILFILSVILLAVRYTPKQGIAINNCTNPPAPYVNWSNCRIEGMQLARQDLTGAQFRNSTLNGADLRGATLVDSEFSYANMSNARLSAADLSNADMVGATLRSANLSNAKLDHANLSFAILHNAMLVNADLRNADLTNAMLSGALLQGAKLDGAILDKAIWTDDTVCAPESVGKCIPVKKPKNL
jgi:hypothetical protein